MTSMCQKISYPSRSNALEDAKLIRVQLRFRNKKLGTKPKAGRKLRPYKCYVCGAWHLTSQPKAKGK